MYDFDEIVQGSFHLAQKFAIEHKNKELTEHHLLLGFIHNPSSIASKYLQEEKKILLGVIGQEPQNKNTVDLSQIKPTKKLHEWITLASSHAIENKRKIINEYDFLKHFKRFFPSIKLDINPDEINNEEDKIPDFLTNLNELAIKGKLDPVIGRSQEIRNVQEVICRRTKNNPVLVGLPGVGKTAIIEGLAGLIVNKTVPNTIKEKIIYSLDMGNLMSGTKYRGEFEKKIKEMLKFINKQSNKSILFIDEIHLLIGAGGTGGSIDAANLLKPSLARGEIHCIGSTTHSEYKKYIETDPALERRFSKIIVEEPSKEETIQILLGLKEKLEIHHGIEITEDAIISAVQYSSQYITEKFLPDKAIDLIDEASAGLQLSADSIPPEIQELGNLIRSKKILYKSQPNDSLKQEIEKMETYFASEKEKWQKKNILLKEVFQYKKKLDQLHFQFQKAEQEGDLDEAARLKHGLIPELKEKIKTLDISWKLDKNKIAEITSKITGIPKSNILKSYYENILNLESTLKKKILGQDQAIKEISNTLLISYLGLADTSKPLGSFLLLGPSGVGKTETVKAVAETLFYSKNNIIRIDLSEYSEAHSISTLIGSPPGYVGYEKGGILTEAVRKKNYSLILFDEIEKAHPNFSDILLQILDEGKLTDTQNNIANFKNTIIFITSNLKNHKEYLKPEIIGRIDNILYYEILQRDTMKSLLIKEVNELNKKIEEQNIQIKVGESLSNKILEVGFSEQYGARLLKSAFKKYVTLEVARNIIINKNKIPPGKYELELDNNKVVITMRYS